VDNVFVTARDAANPIDETASFVGQQADDLGTLR
jgi:hypothetical protein